MDVSSTNAPILSDENGLVSISLPLCDLAYRKLYNSRANSDLRDKELAFVVLTCHHNSSLVRQGLQGAELEEAARRELGLSKTWTPNELVRHAMQHFNSEMDSSIVRYVKNLYKQYNVRNNSIEIIAKKILLLQKQIARIEELGDNNTATTIEKINELVELEKSLDALSKSVPDQIKNFKAALTELEEEAKVRGMAQGGGIITDSMDPKQSVSQRK